MVDVFLDEGRGLPLFSGHLDDGGNRVTELFEVQNRDKALDDAPPGEPLQPVMNGLRNQVQCLAKFVVIGYFGVYQQLVEDFLVNFIKLFRHVIDIIHNSLINWSINVII